MRKMTTSPPAVIDLIEYVKFRTRCTTGMAIKVIMSDALMVDSHPIGYKWQMNAVQGRNVKVLDRYVPEEFRDRIRIVNNLDKKENE